MVGNGDGREIEVPLDFAPKVDLDAVMKAVDVVSHEDIPAANSEQGEAIKQEALYISAEQIKKASMVRRIGMIAIPVAAYAGAYLWGRWVGENG